MTDEKQIVAEDSKSIDKMTVKELRELAKEYEITGTSGMKKDELLTSVKEAQGDSGNDKKEAEVTKEESPKVEAKKPASKKATPRKRVPLTSAKECKVLISSLKKEKISAKANGDKVKTDILRRRINLVKKKSRKFQKSA